MDTSSFPHQPGTLRVFSLIPCCAVLISCAMCNVVVLTGHNRTRFPKLSAVNHNEIGTAGVPALSLDDLKMTVGVEKEAVSAIEIEVEDGMMTERNEEMMIEEDIGAERMTETGTETGTGKETETETETEIGIRRAGESMDALAHGGR